MGRAEKHVEGGKLIRAYAEAVGGRLVSVIITGDFFAFPEEAVEELEKFLVGVSLKEDEIKSAVQEFLRRRGVVLAGVSASDIAEVVYRAASN